MEISKYLNDRPYLNYAVMAIALIIFGLIVFRLSVGAFPFTDKYRLLGTWELTSDIQWNFDRSGQSSQFSFKDQESIYGEWFFLGDDSIVIEWENGEETVREYEFPTSEKLCLTNKRIGSTNCYDLLNKGW